MSTTASPALAVSDLTVGYTRAGSEPNVVVWKVDLTLEPGRILGLAGESGCGKSTTALAAIGYRARGARVLSGRSMLDGEDLLDLPLEALRDIWGKRVAYVAQSAAGALSPAMPVGAQVVQVLERHTDLEGRAAKDRAEELFEAVGLPGPNAALRRYPHQFSGGQQQRIAIAIALACNPRVLVLDEPTTGLDVTTQARIAALLRGLLADFGVAALYVSHDLSLLGSVADRLAVMYAGQIVEQGPAAEVIGRPAHPYSRALLSAVPDVTSPRTLVGIPGAPPERADTSACSFAPRCAYVADACRAGGPPLAETAPAHLARCIRIPELAADRQEHVPVAAGSPTVSEAVLLAVRDLWCEYRANGVTSTVVRGVSLEVRAGETVGIVGESGSGKSTLLRAIAGLHRPARGSIAFDGTPLEASAVKRSRVVRRDMQLVFQNPDSSLNPRQTVLQILGRPIRMFRDEVPRSREVEEARRMLESVKLPASLLHRYPSQLSGGQKQRIAIARAFAAHPRLLLCDEVTSALDVSVQATILELIAELSAEIGTAVVFVSHDLAVVRTVTRRALVLRAGEVCEAGETARLFEAPEHPYTRELVEAVPPSPSALAAG